MIRVDHSEVCQAQPIDDGVKGMAGSPPEWHCETCGRQGWVSWGRNNQAIYLFARKT